MPQYIFDRQIYGFFEGQRPFIVVSDFNTINEIIVKQSENFAARARFPLQEKKEGPHTRIIDARGNHWKRLRTLGSMAFTHHSLKNILPTVLESATLLVDGMQRQKGEINALEFFQEYTLDVICKVALGMRDVRMFHNPYLDACRDVFNRPYSHPMSAIPILFPFVVEPLIAIIHFVGSKITVNSPFFVLMDMLNKNVTQRKIDRENEETKSKDFIDIFLDAEVETSQVKFGMESDTSRKLSAPEIIGHCHIFLLAGFDTTSNSLSYTTHLLANYPEVQKKLIDEVDSFLAEHETIEMEYLNELKYMDAVIKESLRHFPLANIAQTRECTKSCEIGGFRFEVGDMVQVDSWTMHMDKDVWGEDAAEFRPERWLESSNRPRTAFQSFGEGPRICLGMRLAYAEEKVALLEILKRFTIEKTPRTNPIKLVGSLTVSPAAVMVNLVKR